MDNKEKLKLLEKIEDLKLQIDDLNEKNEELSDDISNYENGFYKLENLFIELFDSYDYENLNYSILQLDEIKKAIKKILSP